jgi:hypothetical protein
MNRVYDLNEDQRMEVRARVDYYIHGRSYMSFDNWMRQHPLSHFTSLIERGIRPLVESYNYFLPVDGRELGERVAYWAWEVYAYHHSAGRRRIESLADVDSNKSRGQYEVYESIIGSAAWNDVLDQWEDECVFNNLTLEGAEQRNGLSDFLWKLIRDDHTLSDEDDSDEEAGIERPKGTQLHELGWVTNNRRKF